MSLKVQELRAIVGTPVEPQTELHNNHWYEQICPKNTVSNCFAKMKQCASRLYGLPYHSLTKREVITNYCEAGLCTVASLSVISGITIIVNTPPSYASDPQNLPPYVSIPMCILLYSSATISATVGVVRIYKTYVAAQINLRKSMHCIDNQIR